MKKEMELRIAELSLGGEAPKTQTGTRKTKLARVTALGWRVVAVPKFWAAGQLLRDSRGNGVNPAFIDFSHAREWLVIPPDHVDMAARKIAGRICAIRWAFQQAELTDID
jgi:hypothetical protein